MRQKRTTPDEQLKLIQECRASGLTDYEWCVEHGIRPKTFYTWIYRMKQKGIIDVPATIPTVIPREAKRPEIVKIQVEPRLADNQQVLKSTTAPALQPAVPSQSGIPVMEVMVGSIQLRVTNDVNPQILAQTIQLLRGYKC